MRWIWPGGIAYMHEHCEKVGRATPPQIVLGAVNQPNEAWNPQALLEKIGRMRELGVTTVGATIDGDSRAEWCANAERYGAEIIAKFR